MTSGRRTAISLTIVLLLCAAAATVVMTKRSAADPALLSTTDGRLRGRVFPDHRVFNAIPYAAPPVGDRRWRLPMPVAPWPGERDASRTASPCTQTSPDGNLDPASSEDCLYLNVTTPYPVRSGDRLPVMVWFHGGAFSSGSGGQYDPRRLVTLGKVAVVTVNSRLGVFGYFGHPGLADSGTYGLADQQAALRWVRVNAAAFGGDPRRVTVFGNSSGGANVCAHLASPASAGLFHRAIIQSGSCRQHWPANVMVPASEPLSYWTPAGSVRRAGSASAAQLGCADRDQLECLRATPPDRLLTLTGRFLTMAFGTPLIPHDPREMIRRGQLNRVPVMLGNTRDEHRFFGRLFGIDESRGAAQYQRLLRTSFPEHAAEIAERYPLRAGAHAAELAWAAVGTDSSWTCPTLESAMDLAHHVPTFTYEFADPHPPADPLFPPGFPTGAPHGSEVAYLFDLGPEIVHLTAAQQRLSDRMITYWSAFAREGRPAAPSLWPPAAPGDVTALKLRPEGDELMDPGREHQCGFWRKLS
jgi:para-nitrobenzyl esterase